MFLLGLLMGSSLLDLMYTQYHTGITQLITRIVLFPLSQLMNYQRFSQVLRLPMVLENLSILWQTSPNLITLNQMKEHRL